MLDAKNDHETTCFIDLVDHAVRTASGRSQPAEFTLEFAAETVRIVDERSEHELDDRCRSAFGKSTELSLCRPRNSQSEARLLEARLLVAHFIK